jgi:anti-anti-sigma factor
MGTGLTIHVEEEKDLIIFRIDGRLDASNAPLLERKLREMMDGGRHKILLDFAKVDYLSSAGMRVLLWATKTLNDSGHLALTLVGEEVMEIIKMAGFDTILHIYATEQKAIDAFS